MAELLLHYPSLAHFDGIMEGTEMPVDDVAMVFPLTKDCHHYTRRQDVDWDIQKCVLSPTHIYDV